MFLVCVRAIVCVVLCDLVSAGLTRHSLVINQLRRQKEMKYHPLFRAFARSQINKNKKGDKGWKVRDKGAGIKGKGCAEKGVKKKSSCVSVFFFFAFEVY